MTATTTPRITSFSGLLPARSTLGVAASVLLLKGTMVSKDSDGRADVITNGQAIAGVADATYDNRTGAADAINAELAQGVFEFAYTGTAPQQGQVVFAADNQTVTATPGSLGVAGFAAANGVGGKVKVFISPAVSGSYADVAAVDAVADAAALHSENLSVVEIPVPLGSFRLASGADVPAFSDGVADGFALNSSEGFGIVFNVASTGVQWATVRLPADLDEAAALEIHFLAARIGALDTTAAITVTAFGCAAGVAFDAGANLSSGNTGAIAGATKVASDVHVTANGATAGQVLSFSMVPTAALDADDLVILACWVKCTRTGA